MQPKTSSSKARGRRGRALALAAATLAISTGAMSAGQDSTAPAQDGAATLDETRLMMGKWIETQRIISKERKEWQQGREILLGRVELVKKELATLEQTIREAESGAAESQGKRDELLKERDELVAAGAQLSTAATSMEVEVRKLFQAAPDPVKTTLETLHQRIPQDPATTQASPAERFQNVLGILNGLNKANNEIAVHYEVHELAGGKPAEVQAIYVGLAQAYFVSASGEAGIGRPTPEGWRWESSNAVAGDVLRALEILQGKQSPAFVPLPVRLN